MTNIDKKIKIRVWDGIFNKFLYGTELSHVTWFDESGELQSLSERILERYVGIKDKHGEEIYEGDIIRKLPDEWPSQHLGTEKEKNMTHEEYLISLTEEYTVVFMPGCFMLRKKEQKYNPWYTDSNNYSYQDILPGKHGYIEIIGNIHENNGLKN